MSHGVDLERAKRIPEKRKNIVFGFIRETKELLSINTTWLLRKN